MIAAGWSCWGWLAGDSGNASRVGNCGKRCVPDTCINDLTVKLMKLSCRNQRGMMGNNVIACRYILLSPFACTLVASICL